MRRDAVIDVRALVEQRLHHLEIGVLLQLHLLRLREARARLPHRVDGGPQRRHAVVLRGEVRIGAALDQHHRHVELAVDDRGQQRAGAVAGVDLVDVGAAVEQRFGRLDVALARRVQQRRHAALGRDRRIDLFGIEAARSAGAFGSGGGILPDRSSLARRLDRGLHLAGRRLGFGFLADEAFDDLALAIGGGAIELALLGDVDGPWSTGLASAPRSISAVIASARLRPAAKISGVCSRLRLPRVEVGLGVGEQVDHVGAAGRAPPGAPPWRRWVRSCALTSAPPLSSTLRPRPDCPPWRRGGAACTGRCASPPTMLAPAKTSISASSASPRSAAQCSARHAVALRGADVDALLEQRLDRGLVAAHGGVGHAATSTAARRRRGQAALRSAN